MQEGNMLGDGTLAVSRVLVVDDNPDISRLLRVRLASRGYQVEEASSGDQALARLEEVRPDLIFLDVSMPGISGLEVLGEVRTRAMDVAVIMMTAFGSEEVAIEALRRGADDYLRKPFEPREFQAVLGRTVTRLSLSRHNAILRRQLDEKRRQLEAELARAAEVQAGLLPRTSPILPGFEVAGQCIPAREVGGDFYDWDEPRAGLLTLTIGDVMGKGMPAAILMATVRATLRAVASQNPPAAALELVERTLETDLERSGSFMTLFHAQLDVASRRMAYVDAGHGLVFLKRADGRVEELPSRGLPLGVPSDEKPQEGEVIFGPGDALVLYSDGLIDARSDMVLDPPSLANQLTGVTTAQDMVAWLVELPALTGPPPDDLTVMVLRCDAK